MKVYTKLIVLKRVSNLSYNTLIVYEKKVSIRLYSTRFIFYYII